MVGAPDFLETVVEKLLREEGVAAVVVVVVVVGWAKRPAPTVAEPTIGAATRDWMRSCLEADRRLRLTADMVMGSQLSRVQMKAPSRWCL